MQRLNTNSLHIENNAILVFSVMRNEAQRLPYWLEHYRALGVSKFFVIDNGSDDGTLEILLAQPDCIVFENKESYLASRFGIDWINALQDEYGVGHWCMVADVDELFVFSKKFGSTLPELVVKMEEEGAEGVFTIMVDMYSPNSLKDVDYKQGTPFQTQCNAFDARPYFSLPVKECPYINVVGGVRQRMFFPEFSRRSLVDRVRWKIGNIFKIKEWMFVRPPVVSKVPFIKWRKGCALISSAHTVNPVKLFSARCALLHFKFFGDFHKKALIEIKRNQHYDGSREYRRYFAFFDKNPDFTFAAETTAIYESPDSLEKAGIITTSGNPTDIKGLSA